MSEYPWKIRSMWEIGSMRVMIYCVCGDAMQINTNSIDELIYCLEAFADTHHEEGHGPCDAQTARKARRKRMA